MLTKWGSLFLWVVSIFASLNWTGSKKPVPDCIVSVESMNIFPVGWCETNGYQLRPPRKAIGISSVLFAVVSWVGRGGETFKSRLLQNYCRHHWIWKHSPCTENPCLVQLFPWLLGPVGIHITTPKHSRQCCLETLARCTSMWKQSISHNKEIVSVCMRTHLCYAYTFVWAVLAMVSDPDTDFTLELVQVKLMP